MKHSRDQEIFKVASARVAPAEEGPLAALQSAAALGNVPSSLQEIQPTQTQLEGQRGNRGGVLSFCLTTGH